MVCWKKRVSLENPAAYNDVCFITKAIEDSGLPWCNGALGLVKKDGEGIGSGRGDDGRLRFLSITDLDKAGKRCVRDLAGNPVGFLYGCIAAEKSL